MTLVGANILGYAAAYDAQNAKFRILDDLLRLWSGVPTRHQARRAREVAKQHEQMLAMRASQLRAFSKAGELP